MYFYVIYIIKERADIIIDMVNSLYVKSDAWLATESVQTWLSGSELTEITQSWGDNFNMCKHCVQVNGFIIYILSSNILTSW